MQMDMLGNATSHIQAGGGDACGVAPGTAIPRHLTEMMKKKQQRQGELVITGGVTSFVPPSQGQAATTTHHTTHHARHQPVAGKKRTKQASAKSPRAKKGHFAGKFKFQPKKTRRKGTGTTQLFDSDGSSDTESNANTDDDSDFNSDKFSDSDNDTRYRTTIVTCGCLHVCYITHISHI